MRELDRDLLRFGDLQGKDGGMTDWLKRLLGNLPAYDMERDKSDCGGETVFAIMSIMSYLDPECDLRPCLPSLKDEPSIWTDASCCGAQETRLPSVRMDFKQPVCMFTQFLQIGGGGGFICLPEVAALRCGGGTPPGSLEAPWNQRGAALAVRDP